MNQVDCQKNKYNKVMPTIVNMQIMDYSQSLSENIVPHSK